MTNFTKNWMTASLIASAYLCLPENAMAVVPLINIGYDTDLEGTKVHVTIYEWEQNKWHNKCSKTLELGIGLQSFLCPNLKKITTGTQLKIDVEDKHNVGYCNKEFSYEDPNIDLFLHENRTCTIEDGKSKAKKN